MPRADLPANPYLLLTPGPLTTTATVKAAMLRDWCTWDDDDNGIVQEIRIGNIGDVHPSDIERLLAAVADSIFWRP